MIHKINYHSNEYWGVIGMQAGDYGHVTNGEPGTLERCSGFLLFLDNPDLRAVAGLGCPRRPQSQRPLRPWIQASQRDS